MSYSTKEIKSFEEKDLRISKLAIIKSLIEKLDVEVVNEPEEVLFSLADRYVNYVYEKGNVNNLEDKKEVEKSWVQIAEGLNLTIPNAININALNIVLDECQKANKASANPSDILSFIINKFGKYPTNQKGISKIVEALAKQ